MSEYITSRQNPLVTHIRKLTADRAYRRSCGEFVCDGVKLLDEALKWRVDIKTLVVTPDIAVPTLPGGARLVTVPEDVMASLSPMRAPQGALLVCTLPDTTPPEALSGSRYLVLDGLQDPGNIGTIWRTADAFGADGLFLLHACADPYNHKTVRASMGAAFRFPVWETDLNTLTALLTQGGIPLYAAALDEHATDVRKAGLSRAAVIIGSEGRGVSADCLQACAGTLAIPMNARCESLNAAVAAAVILWQMGGIPSWQP